MGALSPSDILLVGIVIAAWLGGFFVLGTFAAGLWKTTSVERVEEIESDVCDLQDELDEADDPFTRRRLMQEIEELLDERRELLQ